MQKPITEIFVQNESETDVEIDVSFHCRGWKMAELGGKTLDLTMAMIIQPKTEPTISAFLEPLSANMAYEQHLPNDNAKVTTQECRCVTDSCDGWVTWLCSKEV